MASPAKVAVRKITNDGRRSSEKSGMCGRQHRSAACPSIDCASSRCQGERRDSLRRTSREIDRIDKRSTLGEQFVDASLDPSDTPIEPVEQQVRAVGLGVLVSDV
jgi:hypothetical protein